MKQNESNILTTTDVAKLCAVDASTVLNWVKTGKLKSYQTPGGHNRIFKEDLWDFIKEHGLPFLGSGLRPDSTKKKILIVDDDRDFLAVLKAALSCDADWLLETSDSSLEAGLKVGSWQPDLLIMDVKMPGFNGIEFCRFLKKIFGYEKLPVIVVSGVSHNEPERNIMMGLGVFGYIEKSTLPRSLIEKIRQFFSQNI
ncbi:MAG: DNA-binding response regulator, excisionase family protein [uncultured bacterium]|nr:MAG: DNA-binding response regulator, excisionase family protein [uncultured bacterium]